MITRRQALPLLAVGPLALRPQTALAQDWKPTYPELSIAIIPSENISGTIERYAPVADYLTKQLGVPVKLRVAADYAGVIEGQKAGNVHIAFYGAAAYARAWMVTNGAVEIFAGRLQADGSKGYRSVLYVKKDSQAKTIDDLKGKRIALVDPNSTSGTIAPTFFLQQDGKPLDTFFSGNIMAGSHENAVLAVVNGQVDGAFNSWNSDADSTLARMIRKGMVKPDDVRIVWKSPLLAIGGYAYLANMPAALKTAIKTAIMEMPTRDKTTFDRISDGQSTGFFEATHKDYEETVALNKFVDELRKKK